MSDPPGEDAGKIRWQKSWTLFRRFWPYVRPERKRGLLIGLLLVLGLPSSVASPFLVRYLFDVVLPDGDVTRLIQIGVVIVGLTLIGGVFGYIQRLLAIALHNRVRFRITRDLFGHVLRLPVGYFNRTETGYLMARVRDDVRNLQPLMVDTLVEKGVDLARALIFLVLLLFLDISLALSGLLLVATILVLVFLVSPALRRRSEHAREEDARSSSALHQGISGISPIKTAAQEIREVRRFLTREKNAVRAAARRDVLGAITDSVLGLTGVLGVYVIVAVGAYRISIDASTIGNLFAFFMFLMQLIGATGSIFSLVPSLQAALASLQRILELRDENPESSEQPSSPLPRLRIRGDLEFKNVSFAYEETSPETNGKSPEKEPESWALQNIDLRIDEGTVLALVGRSGAGKSTLAHLVCRLFDPTHGDIILDRHPLRHYPLSWLRGQIGVVPQEIFLFDRTIRENLAYARPDASEAAIRQAARQAHAETFITALPQGYETVVGERGVRLSGGEKQRLAIARELLRDPPILILDEATSNLDAESETLIREAMERLMRGRTCIVIAHRLSTVQRANRIVVLDRGEILAEGTHEELLEQGGLYRELHEMQFGKGPNGENPA